MKYLLFILIFIFAAISAFAETDNNIYRSPQGDPTLEANSIKGTQNNFSAEGDIEGTYDFYHLFADKLNYVKDTEFEAENISFFTCKDKEKPHFSVTAGSVKANQINGKYKLSLKDVRFKIKNKTLLKIPGYTYTYNPMARQQFISLPTPAYSKSDGLTFKYSPVLIDKYNLYANAQIKYSLKNHFAYDAAIHYGFDGYANSTMYKTMQVKDTIKYVTNYSLTFQEPERIAEYQKKLARLQAEAKVMYKHKMSTIDKKSINVYRMPEISLHYYLNPMGKNKEFDPRSIIVPSVSVSWCREKDEAANKEDSADFLFDDKYTSKFSTEIELPYCLGVYKGVQVQPVAKLMYNNYKDKSTYKAAALGIDFTKFYKDNSFWDVRYVWAKEKGYTPFEFDSAAYEQGLIFAGQKNWGKYIVGGWGAYNFDMKKAYKYGISLGYKADCFWSGASYDFHDKKLKFNIGLLGF